MHEGRRAFILSRYAGAGSHRYPAGFSGDSVISWKSLQFQPYFTATASNIGYGWWSHDIGGHTHGKRDDELQTRWLQFGVFSPILRMHSTSNPFNGKEPWRYGPEVCGIMTAFLRLRHRLLPYLYSMNWRCHSLGEPLIQPMYYAWPREDAAYQVPNEYLFGNQLIAVPITSPMSPELRLASADAWLPDGLYHDLFTGTIYHGGGRRRLYRPLESIPVLAKAGGIVPLMAPEEKGAIPEALEILVFVGADGAFDLYEDDGETDRYASGEYLLTSLRLTGGEFSLSVVHGARSLYRTRRITVTFCGVDQPASCLARCGKEPLSAETVYDPQKHRFRVTLPPIDNMRDVTVSLPDGVCLATNNRAQYCETLLNRAQIDYELKDRLFRLLRSHHEPLAILRECSSFHLPDGLLEALAEIF